jgi:hypothetical protein
MLKNAAVPVARSRLFLSTDPPSTNDCGWRSSRPRTPPWKCRDRGAPNARRAPEARDLNVKFGSYYFVQEQRPLISRPRSSRRRVPAKARERRQVTRRRARRRKPKSKSSAAGGRGMGSGPRDRRDQARRRTPTRIKNGHEPTPETPAPRRRRLRYFDRNR